MKTKQLFTVVVAGLMLAGLMAANLGCEKEPPRMKMITPEKAKQIAKEAYTFAYPMIEHYKIMFGQAIAEQSPVYEGPANVMVHKRELLDAKYRAVVGANNSTLYTLTWLNLNTEPLVFTVPPIPEDRYFVFQFADVYTHNFAYSCPRVTGNAGGKYLIAGPNWNGETPEGITDVFKSEGDFVFMVGRIYIRGREELKTVHALQDQLDLVTLSNFEGKEAPVKTKIDWPIYNEEKAKSAEFISYVNFLLHHVEIHPTEKELFEKFSKIGIGANKPFSIDKMDPAISKAIEDGVKEALDEITAHASNIGKKVNGWNNFGAGFGNRNAMQGRYLDRAAAAMVGIYGNDPEENSTYTTMVDMDGATLDASKYNYILEFPAGQTPPVKGFWSITMYDAESYMIENPIDRYSIYGEDDLLKYGEGNSLRLYFQHESPGKSKEGNWLPSPNDKFFLGLRIYWPKKEVVDGTWVPPVLKKVKK